MNKLYKIWALALAVVSLATMSLSVNASEDSFVNVEITKATWSCTEYFGDWDFGTQAASYSTVDLAQSGTDSITCSLIGDDYKIEVVTDREALTWANAANSDTIPFAGMSMKATVINELNSSDCNWDVLATDYDNEWVPVTAPVRTFVQKTVDGRTCDIAIPSPDLHMQVPANIAPDTYQGVIMFTISGIE